MIDRKKQFRIERMNRQSEFDAGAAPSDGACNEVLIELAEIKSLIKQSARNPGAVVDAADEDFAAAEQDATAARYSEEELREARKLKVELDIIHEAIDRTKREIATLHKTNVDPERMTRVTDELDAVVDGTEHATEKILAAAEVIDEDANTLSARLKGQDQDLANDIQDKVVKIFEACNFQDLTGQRITKVVSTLKFIEDHINQMIDIWGGIDSFQDVEAERMPEREGDKALLNGPALEDSEDIASQDDIDALFA